jgi:hypothetical protein
MSVTPARQNVARNWRATEWVYSIAVRRQDMRIANVKAAVAKVLTVGFVAGALTMAAPAKAEAEVFVGARFGAPVVSVGPDRFRREEFFRRQEWVRAHEYERFHRGPYGYRR